MAEKIDHGVRELGHARLQLRKELSFTFDEYAGRPCYIIEDRINCRFYRVGVDEYAFLSLLDGTTTVREAVAITAQSLGRDAFSEADAAAICRWLIDADLAHTNASARADRLLASARTRVVQRTQSKMNPLFIKIPLFNPDRFLDACLPWCRWMLSTSAVAVWFLVLLCGLYQIVSQADRFAEASVGILAPSNWILLTASWIALKVIHELFHGLLCKKFGGNVLECGVVLILFAPVPYVDATVAWRLRSKWQRIGISGAGMYFELFCAACAAFMWSYSSPGIASHIAHNVVMMAGLNTILFNGNPLMRFDAYYMLADFLEIPNLSGRGQEYLMYLGRKYLLGVKAELPEHPDGRAAAIKLYGILASWWRGLVLLTLLIAAQALFLGAGLLLAIVAGLLWFGIPLARFAKYMAVGNSAEEPNRIRFVATSGALAITVTLVLCALPWPGIMAAPGVVQDTPMAIVRSEVPGFVAEILVHGNEEVDAGQVIARLVNRELEAELVDVKLAVQANQQLRDHYRTGEQVAASQIQTRYIEALKKQCDEKERQLAGLTVRAPIAGRVVRRRLESLIGTYVEPGSELVTIVGPGKEVRISIGQDDVDRFTQRVGRPVGIRLHGSPSTRLPGRLLWIDPHASRQVPFPPLSAAAGGPLPVRPASGSQNRSAMGNAEPAYELTAPRFSGTVELLGDAAISIHRGELATACFRTHHEAVGGHLYHTIHRWIRRKMQIARISR